MSEATNVGGDFARQVSDVLDILGTGIYCNTFSERGRRQNAEVQQFKDAVCAAENRDKYRIFCERLVRDISSCTAAPTMSLDVRREKSYKLFYAKRKGDLSDSWNTFHATIHLAQPDPVWTQTVNRLLFNQVLVAVIQYDRKQQDRPRVSASISTPLAPDEENVIRYVAGYIPFKLLKVYKQKKQKDAPEVVDCLSEMAQPRPGNDFYAYMQEWTTAISRGAFLKSLKFFEVFKI